MLLLAQFTRIVLSLAFSKVGGLSTTLWFNEETGDFLGLQISPQVGVVSAEAEFIRSTTDLSKF